MKLASSFPLIEKILYNSKRRIHQGARVTNSKIKRKDQSKKISTQELVALIKRFKIPISQRLGMFEGHPEEN